MTARLSVENVSHRFGALDVLRDVSFAVHAEEVLAVVGPSGCGKSTLLSIAGGLLEPSRGEVRTGATPPDALNPLTFVFQDFALLPWRNVADNVAFALEHRGLSRVERDAIVADVLARTGLADFADALPKHLSGGMRQRVGLARALAVRPAVLLMDEPFSALDSQTRELLMDDLVALLARSRLAVVYVTHNLEEAVRLADRVLVLSRRPGAVRAVVPIAIPRAVRHDPVHAPALAAAREDIWAIVRDGARQAERERVDG